MSFQESKTVFRGRIITVSVEGIELPNGKHLEMEIVRHPGGAAVVALNQSGCICLLHQYRYAVGGWIWELPAGKIEQGASPLQTAQHELGEEAGVSALNWQNLGEIISSPGVFNEKVYLFLATDLQDVSHSAEEHEVFERHWVPYEEALHWALSGKLNDAKSIAALFRSREYILA